MEIYNDLLQRAKKVRELAYAPYSHFPVGAALLTAEGEIFTGCNVENASFGLTICAERAAVFAALAAGIIWYGTLKISRYVSVASIASLFSLPLIFITLKMDSSHVLAVLSMAFLALVRHKENIKRIRSGEENQVGKK